MLTVTQLSGFGTFASAPDPYWSSVDLLLNCEGTDGGTTFTDLSGTSTVTAFGNAHTEIDQKKFGATSCALDGTGDYLSVSTITLSSDFTVECWAYFTADDASGYSCVFSGSGNDQVQVDAGSGSIGLVINGAVIVTRSGTAITLNNWHHLAWTRTGISCRCFVDGVQQGSTGTSSTALDIDNIGRLIGSAYEVNGYLDEIRITNGVCRYASDFEPPSEPFPDY